MAIGIVGKKLGMTRLFGDEGDALPVTVVHAEPNSIIQVKTVENDGYKAIQVTKGKRKASRVTKAEAGHFAKANVEAGTGLWEFRLEHGDNTEFNCGDLLKVEQFSSDEKVDVIAISKGKGFQGGVKRHNFSTQDATHGNSLSHRAIGSTGQNQSPGKVFKGKKMPGQMGNGQKTIQNQQVVRVDAERNLILIKGGIPGAPGSDVIIKPSVKSRAKGGAK